MPLNPRVLAAAVGLPFLAFSMWVTVTEGYFGFLTVAGREPWALQVLLDLAIAAVFAAQWMIRDARARGRNPWPWVAATLVVGSIAPLTYVVLGGRSAHGGRG